MKNPEQTDGWGCKIRDFLWVFGVWAVFADWPGRGFRLRRHACWFEPSYLGTQSMVKMLKLLRSCGLSVQNKISNAGSDWQSDSFFCGSMATPSHWFMRGGERALDTSFMPQQKTNPCEELESSCLWSFVVWCQWQWWVGLGCKTPKFYSSPLKNCWLEIVFRVWGVTFLIGKSCSSWWFQIFFIFTPTCGNDPIWLIFFKWVETTN